MLNRTRPQRFNVERFATLDKASDRLFKRDLASLLVELVGLAWPGSKRLSEYPRVASIVRGKPIVIITENQDEESAVQATKLGAQDCLVKKLILPPAGSQPGFCHRGGQNSRGALAHVADHRVLGRRRHRQDPGRDRRELEPGGPKACGYSAKDPPGGLNARLVPAQGLKELKPGKSKDGAIYTRQASIARVKDEHSETTHFIATTLDVTERKELEQQLMQAQKMEAVGRLAGGVAQDLNDLLTIVNGYSELLLEAPQAAPGATEYLRQIRDEGDRAASHMRQLVAFSRRQVMNT